MDERCKALWEKLSAALKPQVSADTFKRWFSAVELTKATEDELTFRRSQQHLPILDRK